MRKRGFQKNRGRSFDLPRWGSRIEMIRDLQASGRLGRLLLRIALGRFTARLRLGRFLNQGRDIENQYGLAVAQFRRSRNAGRVPENVAQGLDHNFLLPFDGIHHKAQPLLGEADDDDREGKEGFDRAIIRAP